MLGSPDISPESSDMPPVQMKFKLAGEKQFFSAIVAKPCPLCSCWLPVFAAFSKRRIASKNGNGRFPYGPSRFEPQNLSFTGNAEPGARSRRGCALPRPAIREACNGRGMVLGGQSPRLFRAPCTPKPKEVSRKERVEGKPEGSPS